MQLEHEQEQLLPRNLEQEGPIVVLEDLNGTHYLGLQEGEVLGQHVENLVIFPPNCNSADQPLQKVELSQAMANDFLVANVRKLCSILRDGAKVFTVSQAAIIAYHRLLAIKHGLISDKFVPENFFVDYTEAVRVTEDQLDELPVVPHVEIRNALPKPVQQVIRETFTDRVSLVAFVFRARGHHYVAEYEELYQRVWKRCRHDANMLHISFQHMATSAFHAIFPVVLDDFWLKSVENNLVNGALAKRLDVAPAGAAGPYVIRQGIMDLEIVAPGIKQRLEDASQYLNMVFRQLQVHRYAGSVNARYYGAKKVKFDETRLAAIAATIRAAIDNLVDEAPLGKSPALTRIANNAPITGAVLGKAIGRISDRPEVVNTLLIEAPPIKKED